MSAQTAEDAAWVRVQTPLTAASLSHFIENLERLFRINSLLEILQWESAAGGKIEFEALNLSNGKPLQSALQVERIDNGIRVHYQDQLKSFTSFQVEADAASGSTLVVTDDYSGTPEAERNQRLDEVDLSLNQWGQDLHNYLRAWHRWSWLPPWRWYMQRVWQPMKPSARRITRWILWITLGEMALILLLIAILVIEQ